MRNGIVRQFLFLVVIILLSKESLAFKLTEGEASFYNELKAACVPSLMPDCKPVGDKIVHPISAGYYGTQLQWWCTNPTCYTADPITFTCPCFASHVEWSTNYPPNTALTEISTCKGGSIINVNEGTLGESVSIVGTPFDLVYSSDRVPGNAGNYLLHIPLTGEGAIGVDLGIHWLGQSLQQTLFDTDFYDFTWNGLSTSGQEILEPIKVIVRHLSRS